MIVIFHEERQRFEAITSYMERQIPKAERWRWDASCARWYATEESVARRLARYAQGTAATRLIALSEAEKQALADSQARDLDLEVDIPAPGGLAYLPFQRAGIFYALNRRGTLIGDEMGLGKTVQAVGVVNMLPAAARVLIVCPATLRLNWRAEWRRWHTGSLRPVLLDTWPRMFNDAEAEVRGKALIVSYDSVHKWHPMIAEVAWDILILDEAHLVRSEAARRTKALFGGRYKGQTFKPVTARRKLFLTGTGIVNKAADLWPLVKALDPEGLGASRVDFMERYGANTQLAELHMRLRTRIMVRRLKEDVLADLPAKQRQIVLLDVPDSAGILRAESQAISLAQAMIEKTRLEIAGLPHAEQVMKLRQGRSIALSEIARVRKETAVKKLPQAVEHINDILGNVEKVVVFAHHHDVLDALAAAFARIAVCLDGRTSEDGRALAVSRFQQDRRVRLFIGGIRSAGLGLTLTAASTVVFAELDWTPAAMKQAEDRLHRIGQKSSVLVQHLVVDGSIDAKMARIIVEKQAVMDAALDGGSTEGGRDVLEEVLRA
jgi:SWI/SNF-related matrix-associated actin-dependent regulator 1 of chromatin subfamily A